MDLLKKQFLKFIQNPNFPCIGAKAAAKKKCIDIFIASDLTSTHDDTKILAMLYEFINQWKKNKDYLQTACVIFKNPIPTSEKQFEALLWHHLQKLHELDASMFPWDASVSSDISNPNFSFSLGEQGFFVVGLHPQSSRKARQFSHPTLIFNLHAQFELIKENGVFEKMRDKIRAEDIKYSGSINPMMSNFGQTTEAIQYSGRVVPNNYICPFQNKTYLREDWHVIEPCSGASFVLKKDDFLVVEDAMGEQVADLFCFSKYDLDEFLSSGKSIDYNQTVHFTTHNTLFSNKSNAMMSIVSDDVGVHDFLFAPCNKDTFRILYHNKNPKLGCYEHLVKAFEAYKINPQYISTTFNIFMNVSINKKTGELHVNPPLSKEGNKVIFKSHMDLIVGLTACSALQSNNYSFKPIRYKIISSKKGKIN